MQKRQFKTFAQPEDEYRIRQFLALIRFRYVPNHIHPSEICLESKVQFKQNYLPNCGDLEKFHLKFRKDFTELGELSKGFIKPIADELQMLYEILRLLIFQPQLIWRAFIQFCSKIESN